jgi:hypothetical protein
LDWHHSQLRIGVTRWVFFKSVIQALPTLPDYGGLLPPSVIPIEDISLFIDNEKIMAYGKSVVNRSLEQLLQYWLKNKEYVVDTFSIRYIYCV